MLLGTLGASLSGNILAAKVINRDGGRAIAKSVSEETKLKRQSRGNVRAGYGSKKGLKATTKRQGHKSQMDFLCRLIL